MEEEQRALRAVQDEISMQIKNCIGGRIFFLCIRKTQCLPLAFGRQGQRCKGGGSKG